MDRVARAAVMDNRVSDRVGVFFFFWLEIGLVGCWNADQGQSLLL